MADPSSLAAVMGSANQLISDAITSLMTAYIGQQFLRGCLSGDKISVNLILIKTPVTMVTGLTVRMGKGGKRKDRMKDQPNIN